MVERAHPSRSSIRIRLRSSIARVRRASQRSETTMATVRAPLLNCSCTQRAASAASSSRVRACSSGHACASAPAAPASPASPASLPTCEPGRRNPIGSAEDSRWTSGQAAQTIGATSDSGAGWGCRSITCRESSRARKAPSTRSSRSSVAVSPVASSSIASRKGSMPIRMMVERVCCQRRNNAAHCLVCTGTGSDGSATSSAIAASRRNSAPRRAVCPGDAEPASACRKSAVLLRPLSAAAPEARASMARAAAIASTRSSNASARSKRAVQPARNSSGSCCGLLLPSESAGAPAGALCASRSAMASNRA